MRLVETAMGKDIVDYLGRQVPSTQVRYYLPAGIAGLGYCVQGFNISLPVESNTSSLAALTRSGALA